MVRVRGRLPAPPASDDEDGAEGRPLSIFISYSHANSEFVDRLALQLVLSRFPVFLDRWALRPGDSLIQRIQEEVADASALVVVLSTAAVESEWCKKELAVALTRELRERRTLVIPALLEDCVIPPFLSDKLYADFRTDFARGFEALLTSLAGVASDGGGRSSNEDTNIDWSIDWGMEGESFRLGVKLVESTKHQPHSVLTTVVVRADERATSRYRALEAAGFDDVARSVVLTVLAEFLEEVRLSLLLTDAFPKHWTGSVGDRARGGYSVELSAQRLGGDPGMDTVLHVDAQVRMVTQEHLRTARRLDPKDQARLARLMASLP